MIKPGVRLIFALFVIIFPGRLLHSQPIDPRQEQWVDSVLNSLTREEMIAQLMVVRANNPNQPYFDVIDKYIREYNIGGVTFFGGKPAAQAIQTNEWQSIAKTPLFISIDGEWGPAMRLDSTLAFPYQMTLGAICNDTLIYRMGLEVARQCKALGIQFNFAPVVDINSNPSNPVIHMRSFGENKTDVARKGIMYMKGMQDGGLLVTAKHFPGHGDTDTDSHSTLPLIPHSKERLDTVETYPFRALIQASLDGIMIAHLNIPALEKNPGTPSTLSCSIVTDYLRNELQFQGLIVTDALDMKGVTLNNAAGEIELEAFKAGNDILLLSGNVPLAISRMSKAVATGEITEEDLVARCRRVLTFKYKAGLADWKPVDISQLEPSLNAPSSELTARLLFEEAVTLLKNDNNLLPLTRLDTLRIASVSIGYGQATPFQDRLQYYAPVDTFALKKEPTDAEITSLLRKLKPYNLIIISLQNTSIWGGSPFGISQQALKFIRQCASANTIVLDLFATPYALKLVEDIDMEALVLSYQDHPLMQDMSAQAIFGGIPIIGKLPVNASSRYQLGAGIQTGAIRLKYILPEEIGIDRAWLAPIDSIVAECIRKRVFPGCEVWAAKDGKVFFMKSFGYHTYEKTKPVGTFDIYDLASLTKISATTLSIMKLEEEGKIDIDRQIQDYLPYLQNTSKGRMIIREMMAHQARLKPWIPFYKYTLKNEKLDSAYYRNKPSGDFPTRVAENIFLVKGFQNVIYDSIISSRFLPANSYKYSDLGFYLLPEVIKNTSGEDIDVYTDKLFYRPLGLSTTGYLPRERFSLDRIVPTEDDLIFRKQLVHGDVHDPGAAMLGGVSGHAGLFSDANDLGILSQMFIQAGTYGGEKYLDPGTLAEYTRQQFPLNQNRRGVGFDRPLPDYTVEGPCCKSASQGSFGHTGFTGTYMWIDPSVGLTYVFLSNRVHPDAENNNLSNLRIRPKIHQLLYDAIEKSPIFDVYK